ncbi:unnamed protein product [Enterobius vermicularis]|uniref:Troponin T n=1 Tax=Enterobius vermicularis TaxID=51028 RepID=A0A0N4V369_ENTVE|nr:unnamed protein product [Enterobius vermicularis]
MMPLVSQSIQLRSSQLANKKENLTEAEKAMLAARKRQEKDQEEKLLNYEEQRRVEREKEEEELRALKEKQERRRLEREREEREFALRQEQEEKRRKQEEEERKARIEADRKKKEEEKKKRALLSQATFSVIMNGHNGGRNFVIPTKTDRADKFGNIVQAKQEMGMTKEQQEEAKRNYLSTVARTIDIPANDITSLKDKIRVLHQKICRLEADKYDLEKRQERQEYDLRELNERQRQVARNNALKKGIDPADSASSRYPPKVSIISKYDRQSDRRNFAERRAVFENKKAFPCFPNMPPPPTVYEKVILKLDDENDGENEDEEEYEDERFA